MVTKQAMLDDDNEDYTDCRVMVDANGEVVRNDEGGYCMLNIKDKSVIVLPPGEESEVLINKLLLQSQEQSTEPILNIEMKIEPEEVVITSEGETSEITTSFWSKLTPEIEGCRNCTELLIKIVGSDSMQKILKHRNTSKKKVWQVIAKKMSEHGYRVPGPTLTNQGEKAHQKWRNIEKMYVKFKNHLKQTRNAPERIPPPYFEAMDKVLAKKYDVQPRFIFNSLSGHSTNGRTPDSPTCQVGDNVDDCVVMSSVEQNCEFGYDEGTDKDGVKISTPREQIKFKSRGQLFLAEIKKVIVDQCAKDREAQKRRHEEIKEILEKQIEQRDDMLSILRKFVEEPDERKSKSNDSG